MIFLFDSQHVVCIFQNTAVDRIELKYFLKARVKTMK